MKWEPSKTEGFQLLQESDGSWHIWHGKRVPISLDTMRQIAALCGEPIPDLVEKAEKARQAYYREYAEHYRRLAAEDEAKAVEPVPLPGSEEE